MDAGYPITLDLTGRRALVIGGGPVAARRAAGMLAAGAVVEVIAPWVTEDLQDAASEQRLVWHQRDYVVGVGGDAARIWCVRADDATASNAWTPATQAPARPGRRRRSPAGARPGAARRRRPGGLR